VRRAAVALLLAATACGGGNAKPQATTSPEATTPAPTQSTAAVAPEAKAIRDAVAKTLAACPCAVEVWAGSPSTGQRVTLTGVYDPRTQSTELTETDDGKRTGVRVRVVDGRTFLDPGTSQWLELDFSNLPKKTDAVLAPLALADPRVSFAAASGVANASLSNTSALGTMWDVEYDMVTARAATGPWTDLMNRLAPEVSVYGNVWVKNGLLHRMSLDASGTPADDDDLSVTFTVTRTGAPAPNVAVPAGARKVDASTTNPGR
jgi:hypothetical protein